MKKKIVIVNVVALAVVFLVLLSAWLLTRPEVLGDMERSFTEPATSASDVSFDLESGERIKLSFRSDVISGELDIFLCDSQGNEVYELDRAKELETYFTPDLTDTYTLTAEYIDFVGSYSITVCKAG